MAGVGEASAIIGTIHIGFSLARTLIAVVGDYKSAREDINIVATEIDATLKQAAELDTLVSNNTRTRRLNDNGLQLAEKCKVDLTRIVEKLIGELTKAKVPKDQTYTIQPEDIEVGKFTRTAWVFLKPRVKVIQHELNNVRLQILLAHTCIDAESAPKAEDRAAASKLIPGLRQSRAMARQMVRKAQNESDKAQESAMSNRGIEVQSAPFESGISIPPARRRLDATRRSRYASSHSTAGLPVQSSYGSALDESDTDRLAEEIRRELEQELLAKLEQQVEEQEAKKAYEQRMRDEAVEGYKKDTRDRLSVIKERSAETQRRLLAAFTSELPATEIQDFLDAQHSQELNDEFVQLMIDSYKAPSLSHSSVKDVDTLSQRTGSSHGSTKSWLSKLLPTKSRRGTSMYSTSAHSKEALLSVPVTRYTHLQVISHHDRPSVLPLDDLAFPHHPCATVCDAQRTSTIWASLSPLCEATILDYISRNCPLPVPARWQLHSAWPITQQLSRRGRYLQRALLGSQLLPWQGSFIVVFSAVCASPQSSESPPKAATIMKPDGKVIKEEPEKTEPAVAVEKPTKTSNGQQMPDEAATTTNNIRPMIQQPPSAIAEIAPSKPNTPANPPTSSRRSTIGRHYPREHGDNMVQFDDTGSRRDLPPRDPFSEPPSGHQPTHYSNMPYAQPSVLASAPSSYSYEPPPKTESQFTDFPNYHSLIPYPYPSPYPWQPPNHFPPNFPHSAPPSAPLPPPPPPLPPPHYPPQYAGSLNPFQPHPPPAVLHGYPGYPPPSSSQLYPYKSGYEAKPPPPPPSPSPPPRPAPTPSWIGSRRGRNSHISSANSPKRKNAVTFQSPNNTGSFVSTRRPKFRYWRKGRSGSETLSESSESGFRSASDRNGDESPDSMSSGDDSEFDNMVVKYMDSGRGSASYRSRNDDDSDSSADGHIYGSNAPHREQDGSDAPARSYRGSQSATVQEHISEDDEQELPAGLQNGKEADASAITGRWVA